MSKGITVAAPAPQLAGASGRSNAIFNAIAWVVLIVSSLLWLVPTLWALKNSFTSNATSALGASEIAKDWSLTTQSYSTMLKSNDLWNWYTASFATGIVTVFLSMVTATMAGFAHTKVSRPSRWKPSVGPLGRTPRKTSAHDPSASSTRSL